MAKREMTFNVGPNTPTDIVPQEVGARFTQTVDNEAVEFEVVRVERDAALRRTVVFSVEVTDG